MSKALIIKGADFSHNSVKTINPNPTISWVIDDREWEANAVSQAQLNYAPFTPDDYQSLQNKTISKIRLIPRAEGEISILLATGLGSGQTTEVAATLEITSDMVLTPTEFDVSIPVGNKVVMVSSQTDSTTFNYLTWAPEGETVNYWYSSLSANPQRTTSRSKLCVSLGVYE